MRSGTAHYRFRIGLSLLAVPMTAVLFTVTPISAEIHGGVPPCQPVAAHHFGNSVAGGADLNNDGVSEYIVGASNYEFGASKQGMVYVFSGQDGSLYGLVEGPNDLSQFGYSVDFLGDVNNDGTPDILVGAPRYNSNRGRAYVYSGSDFSLIQTFEGEVVGDRFGFSVSNAGDVNDDGYDEIIVGAPGAVNGTGRIYVYNTANWSLRFSDQGEAPHDSMGYSVSGAGDVNADGHDDVVVGAPYFDGVYGPNNGRTYVLSGANGDLLCWDYGPNANAHFGWSVSELGDADGDGKIEFLVGSPGRSGNDGMVQVSQKDGFDALDICDLVHVFYGSSEGRFGSAVGCAGRIDNDTRPDIVIGAPAMNGNKGGVYVYLADAWYSNCFLEGTVANARLGYSVASAGDVASQDSRADVVIGAVKTSGANGGASVYSGNDCSKIREHDSQVPWFEFAHPITSDTVDANEGATISWAGCNDHLAPMIKVKCIRDGYDGPWKVIPNNGSYFWVPGCLPNGCDYRIVLSTLTEYAADTSEAFLITAWYRRGDANGDGQQKYGHNGSAIDISDAVYLIQYIFCGGPAPVPMAAGDANCDGAVDISDAVYLVAFIFSGGPAPCEACQCCTMVL